MRKLFLIAILCIFMVFILIKVIDQNSTAITCNVESGKYQQFYIITDPHYLSKIIHDDGEAFQNFIESGDKLVQYTGEIFDALQNNVNEKHPNYLIITGDLTCNGEKKSHIELANRLKQIENSGTGVFVVPGNHDIDNPNAKNYFGIYSTNEESINSDEFKALYQDYGFNEAISLDSDSLSYLAAPSEDLWLLMLDSTNGSELCGELSSNTLNWIMECSNLANEKNAELIAVMHHNLIDHSNLIYENYTVKDSGNILKTLHSCGVNVVLTGHIHIQDIKLHKQEDYILYDIATSSISVYPHQYGVIEYCPQNGLNYYTSRLDMEKYIDQKEQQNFFIMQCCKEQLEYIEKLENLSPEEKKEVFEIIAKMNQLYFSGYRNEKMEELTNTNGFKLLKNIAPCFIQEYAMSMLDDEISDHNVLKISNLR